MPESAEQLKDKPEKIPQKPEPEEHIQPDPVAVPEIGGQSGPEPTRYGDWEKNGRCSDF